MCRGLTLANEVIIEGLYRGCCWICREARLEGYCDRVLGQLRVVDQLRRRPGDKEERTLGC